MASKIRIMTHNLWYRDINSPDWEEIGADCSAPVRSKGLLRVYRETCPDIIGCQEASPLMYDLLKEGLTEAGENYAILWGRQTPILYRPDKFELLHTEFGTYPEEVDGYDGSFNNEKSKSWNIGVFKIKENGSIFVFATTHLWWKQSPSDKLFSKGSAVQAYSDEAREFQLALLIKKVESYRQKYDCPAIIVGDLNTDYESRAIRHALAHGFRHAHDIATDYSEESVGYHNCFPWGYEEKYFDTPFEKAIDHILLIGEPKGAVRRFERFSPDWYFPVSDHSAAYIDAEL